jgi:hypothetical protein
VKTEPKNDVGFDAFADEFMKTYAKTNNKPSEQKNKELILRRHLRPAFGHLNLGDIRAREIERLKAELLDGTRSRKTVNNVLACLGKLLRYAQELELIDRAPRIRLLKVDKQNFRFLDFEQYDALLAAAKPEADWYAAILLAPMPDFASARSARCAGRTSTSRTIGSPWGGRCGRTRRARRRDGTSGPSR